MDGERKEKVREMDESQPGRLLHMISKNIYIRTVLVSRY